MCILFNYAVRKCIAPDDLMMVNNKFERMWAGLVMAYFRLYSSICLQELRKTMRVFSQSSKGPSWVLNQSPSKYKLGALTLEPICLIGKYITILFPATCMRAVLAYMVMRVTSTFLCTWRSMQRRRKCSNKIWQMYHSRSSVTNSCNKR
jgi:hypothetical protein